MAKFNGTLMVITLEDKQIANLTSNSLTAATNMFETTDKESGGDREVLPGLRQWSGSADLNLNFQSANFDMADVMAAWKNRTLLDFIMTTDIVGDQSYSGTCYIENVEMNGPMEDVATATVTLAGTGALVLTTIV